MSDHDSDFAEEVEREAKRIRSKSKGLSKALDGFKTALVSPALTAGQVYERMLSLEDSGRLPIPTGLSWWDDFAGPYRRGNTYVIAGYPGTGKTTLALNQAWSMAVRGYKTWFYCLELTSAEAFEVLAGHITKKAPPSRDDKTTAYSIIEPTGFRFYEPGGHLRWDERLDEICSTVENEKIDVVFIDNLMFLTRVISNSFDVEGFVSSRIKGLAQCLGIPIILLHHLRKPESDSVEPTPNLYSMRGSGAIAADASDVFILHHPLIESQEELRHPVGYVISGKPRWGRGGKRFVRLAGEERTYYPARSEEYPHRKGRKKKFEEDPF